jgi:hypothetical protein
MLFFLCGERRPGAVPEVENAYKTFALVQGADNSVGAWFFPKKQMATFLAFPNDCTALRQALQTVNLAGQIIEPSKGALGGFRVNEVINGLHVSQGAVGQPNEVWHGCGGLL